MLYYYYYVLFSTRKKCERPITQYSGKGLIQYYFEVIQPEKLSHKAKILLHMS